MLFFITGFFLQIAPAATLGAKIPYLTDPEAFKAGVSYRIKGQSMRFALFCSTDIKKLSNTEAAQNVKRSEKCDESYVLVEYISTNSTEPPKALAKSIKNLDHIESMVNGLRNEEVLSEKKYLALRSLVLLRGTAIFEIENVNTKPDIEFGKIEPTEISSKVILDDGVTVEALMNSSQTSEYWSWVEPWELEEGVRERRARFVYFPLKNTYSIAACPDPISLHSVVLQFSDLIAPTASKEGWFEWQTNSKTCNISAEGEEYGSGVHVSQIMNEHFLEHTKRALADIHFLAPNLWRNYQAHIFADQNAAQTRLIRPSHLRGLALIQFAALSRFDVFIFEHKDRQTRIGNIITIPGKWSDFISVNIQQAPTNPDQLQIKMNLKQANDRLMDVKLQVNGLRLKYRDAAEYDETLINK